MTDPGIDEGRRTRLSKFLSGLLRHFPDEYGVDLDAGGWADRETVEAVVTDRYDWADADAVAAVVTADPKGRFETRDGEIRAAYGHSVDVDLDAGDGEAADQGDVPTTLYHGTAPGNLDAILEEGLRPMGRREVHLSPDVETARAVGRRHADEAAILEVDVGEMRDDGFRVSERGPETYTADRVPPAYLSRLD
ncbi:RNA 2'-phosphotransferase [Natronomonas salina]|uniref:RNA 2'-phosphotransferase n=1 Tax=Natronomonas salina TaxID=1710540 RepID=UPI0015B6A684|nr:RNA 2'-phosphotransferase [Natronomonas salina]QLD88944.1 RNA 2'-phosphotransferase [Natronomonas salina]